MSHVNRLATIVVRFAVIKTIFSTFKFLSEIFRVLLWLYLLWKINWRILDVFCRRRI